MSYTQGPWAVVHELRPDDEAVADLVNDTWVIAAHRQRLGDWNEDANLIAAAPDMLEALREVRLLMNAGAFKAFDGEPWLERVEAAIRKATGATP